MEGITYKVMMDAEDKAGKKSFNMIDTELTLNKKFKGEIYFLSFLFVYRRDIILLMITNETIAQIYKDSDEIYVHTSSPIPPASPTPPPHPLPDGPS